MFQMPLIKDLLICYVCGRIVEEKNSVYIGHGLRRHLKCRPGSRKWLNSQVFQTAATVIKK